MNLFLELLTRLGSVVIFVYLVWGAIKLIKK